MEKMKASSDGPTATAHLKFISTIGRECPWHTKGPFFDIAQSTGEEKKALG